MFPINSVAFITLTLSGLGLFLYAITSLSKILKGMTSSFLSNVINKISNNPFIGLLVGTFFTAIIQSSSGTSALTIGLVRAGVMSFTQASAIIIGANIGTTITSFIVAIPFSEYIPLVLFVGSLILLFATKKRWSNIGELCFSFGALFLGLWLMEMNLSSIANEEWFISFFKTLNNSPWLGLLIGIVATVCLQSSSAVIGVVQGLYVLSAGTSISLFGILPVIFGANIGTTSTALFASLGGSKESKKVALFHVLFNTCGALLFMGIIYIFRPFLESSASWGYIDTNNQFVWYVSPMLQIALCHLIFNFTTGLIFFLLLKPITKLIDKVIPTENKKKLESLKPLDLSLMKSFPSEGLKVAKDRILIMFNYAKMMFESIDDYLINNKSEDADFVLNIEDNVDKIDRQLNAYLSSCDKSNLNEENISLLLSILKASKDIERIADYGENIINFYKGIDEHKDKMNKEEMDLFSSLNKDASSFIDKTKDVYQNSNKDEGLYIIQKRREYNAKLDEIIDKHFSDEIKDNKQKTRFVELIYVDLINSYQRVYSHCSNIAKIFGTDKVYN